MAELFDLCESVVKDNGEVVYEGINMGDPAPQGRKILRWHELLAGPDGWKYRAAGLRPGKVNYNYGPGGEDIPHPSWKGLKVPPKFVSAGTGAQGSQDAWTSMKFRDAGIFAGEQTPTGHTRRRLPLWDLDISDHHFEGVVLIGPSKGLKPGELRAGTTPGECVGLYRPKGGMVKDVAVHGCFAGEEWVNDHQWSIDVDYRGNACAIHWASNRGPGRGGLGDQHIKGKIYLTDQRLASFLVHPYASIANLELSGGHAGMSPWWIIGYDPTNPAFPIFGGDEVLDPELMRALIDGLYSDVISREAANGQILDMLGTRRIGSMPFVPTNDSGTFTEDKSKGWYWPELPARAAIDVGQLNTAEFHFQPPLYGPIDPTTGERRPAVLAQKIKNFRTGDLAGLISTLKAGQGQLVEIRPGLPKGERPFAVGIYLGSLHGGDEVEVRVGHGDIGLGELVQASRRPFEWGEVTRHDASSEHGCVGVNMRTYLPGQRPPDGRAWHFATRIRDHRAPIKVWHGEDADALHPDEPWPSGTLLKPSTEAEGCATRAEDWGDGQIVGILREEAPVGTTLPDCTITIKD